MKYYIKPFFFLSVFVSLFAMSCLKDKDFDNGSIQSNHATGAVPQIVELKLTATNTSEFLILAIDNSQNDTTIDLVPVNLATADPAPEDLHVTVDLDSTLVDDFNAANGTSFSVPSSDMYTILNPVVTIPKGSHTGYVQIKFKPVSFLGGNWALGFTISSVQEQGYTISGNNSTGVVNIAVKNDYDGVYHAVGHFDHPVYAGDYDNEWELSTSGPTSVDFQLNTTVLFGVIITLTVDPATNLVTVTSGSVALDPYDPAKNYYDPSTRTFYLDFGYSGGTRHLVGTATYEHPR